MLGNNTKFQQKPHSETHKLVAHNLRCLRNNATNNRVLSFKFLLPVVENTDLFLREAFERRIDVLLILGHLGQSSARVLASEHGVGATGAVERNACCDVEDAALQSHIDGLR